MRFAMLQVSLLLVGSSPLWAADPTNDSWTQWRGPNRTSRIAVSDWPTTLKDAQMQAMWRVPLSPSYSGPIVSKDKVFVTETRDRTYEVVTALDRKTGKQLWKAEWEGAIRVPFFARANGDWIRATPALSEGRLYVAGIRDVLVCLDADSGKQIWRVDFVEKVGSRLPSFGCVSSPLIDGNFVFVQAGGSFVKLDKRTGKVVWRVLRDGGGMYGSAFSSPIIATIAGKKQLVVQTRKALTGVDIKSGAVLWSQDIPAFRGMNILTPTVWRNTVFTSSYGGRSLLIGISRRETSLVPQVRWVNKTQAYMSSPVIVGDYAYVHLRNRRVCCIDLRNGKTNWISKPFGKYWSMVTNGKKILALDERGELVLLQANPRKLEVLSRRSVSQQESWAHLAICGDQVFVRDLRGLTVLRWSKNLSRKKLSANR